MHRKPEDHNKQGEVKAPEGMVTVYRYWSAAHRDHMYTSSYAEFQAGAQGYVLEGTWARHGLICLIFFCGLW